MTESISRLEHAAKSARTAREKIRVVQQLRDWPTLEAIPVLAGLDRKANGWLFILVSWAASTLAALVITACILIFWVALWAAGIHVSIQLVDQLHPGLGLWATVGAIVLAAVILYYDPRLHELVEARLQLGVENLPFPLRWGLQAVRALVYLLVMLVTVGVLSVVCLVPVLTAVDWVLWLIRDGDRLLPYFSSMWMLGVGMTVIVILAVLGLRFVRKKSVLVIVGVCVGVWGLMRLVLAANALLLRSEWLVVGVILGAALIYRTRLPFALARATTLPLCWFQNSTHRLADRLRLRRLLWTTVRHHRRRNVSRTGKKWKRALCSKCIARLERQQVRLAYRRRLRYAWCRHCHSDVDCYQDVGQTQGWLDQSMDCQQEQAGDTVRVNLLSYVTDRNKELPLDLDSVVVADASDHEIEAFLTVYQEKGAEQPIQPLRALGYRIDLSASIGPNVRAMLAGTFAKEERV